MWKTGVHRFGEGGVKVKLLQGAFDLVMPLATPPQDVWGIKCWGKLINLRIKYGCFEANVTHDF